MTAPRDEAEPAPPAAFTGRARRRKTKASIKVADALAKWVFTIGGLGVVVALASIIGYLVWVTLPLFGSASMKVAAARTLPAGDEAGRPVAVRVDEFKKAVWLLDETGSLDVYSFKTGDLIRNEPLSAVPVTAVSAKGDAVALGLEDGTVMLGTIRFTLDYPGEVPEALAELAEGRTLVYDGGVAGVARGNLRITRVEASLGEPQKIGKKLDSSPVLNIDYLRDGSDQAALVLREDGRLLLELVSTTTNMMTGEERVRLSEYELPTEERPEDRRPLAALLRAGGEGAYLVYEDGLTVRYDLSDPSEAKIVERADVTPEAGVGVSSVRMLLGDETMIVGDTAGGVSGWFAAPYPPEAYETMAQRDMTPDFYHLVEAHRFDPAGDAPVTAIARSGRDRQFAAADAAGNVGLHFMVTSTTEAVAAAPGRDIRLIELAPRGDALVALTADRELLAWDVDNPHPGGEFAALFTPIHYEGYGRPEWVWQSGGATDAAEPKQSFVPLLFGTLKATFYAMLFAVPIAILAAIYSSEFMAPGVRSVVKPTVEMMAGLPSVVLGFVGGLVLAPILGDFLSGALLVFVSVPVGLFLFGYGWQLLPPAAARAVPPWATFGLMLLAVLLTGWATWAVVGPLVEDWLFYGDLKGWLDRRVGLTPAGDPTAGSIAVGWVALLTPLMLVLLVILFNTFLRPRLALWRTEDRRLIGLLDAGRFLASFALAAGMAWAVGYGFGQLGFDLRGQWPGDGRGDWSPAGFFDPRNSLVIGLVMGFAVIPIIFTVSEDALSSVPNTLRSASLGAGATPWQTAVRVVLPVAVSGIFSACMIGLGRAAGETMIVLMAYGGTPLMDASLFNGGRTFSANIAIELPEAPKGDTLFRRLFLSGVLLFGLTFLVNTLAELVRIRFRARTKGL